MLRDLYLRTLKLSTHPHAVFYLCLVSFVESFIFPIPPDTLLVPMCLADKKRAYTYAGLCTLASVLGAYVGYLIGYMLYESIGLTIISTYRLEESFKSLSHLYDQWGFFLVIASGLAPIPFKLMTISSGLFGFNLIQFTIAAILARSLRFYGFAQLIRMTTPSVDKWIEDNLHLIALLFFLVFLGWTIFF